MKKFFMIFMAISLLNLTVRAGNSPVSSIEEAELAAKFKELDNLESYVSQNSGTTLSMMLANDQSVMIAAADIDVLVAQSHQNPHKKGMPSFKDKPWLYIGMGAFAVLVIGLYVITGGEGYSSR